MLKLHSACSPAHSGAAGPTLQAYRPSRATFKLGLTTNLEPLVISF